MQKIYSMLNRGMKVMFRVGHGYDVHKFAKDRKLILGGVDISHEMGLLGHSDADVLLHAIMDSLLGAAALGDIGKYFSDTDEKFKDANSMGLLRKVCELVRSSGFEIENIDSTIIAQSPKLFPFIENMRKNISDCCGISIDQVSVKATTEEGLGFTGQNLGIAAHAVCLITYN